MSALVRICFNLCEAVLHRLPFVLCCIHGHSMLWLAVSSHVRLALNYLRALAGALNARSGNGEYPRFSLIANGVHALVVQMGFYTVLWHSFRMIEHAVLRASRHNNEMPKVHPKPAIHVHSIHRQLLLGKRLQPGFSKCKSSVPPNACTSSRKSYDRHDGVRKMLWAS